MSDESTRSIKIDIWSDVTCVWCHIAKRRLDTAVATFEAERDIRVDVELHAYQLDPNPPVDYAGRYTEYLTDVMGLPATQVRERFAMIDQIGEDVGLHFDWQNLRPANTLRAHQLTHLAEQHDLQPEMNDQLLAAYFEHGRDIGAIDDLVDLAAEVGIDRHVARDALDTERFLPAVRADIDRAAEQGIQAVPFFLIDNRYGLSGARDATAFTHALELAAQQQTTGAAS